jgi:cysteine desulfurase/selenocysteine lyase
MSATPRLGDRSLFPRLQEGVYLNHAGVSPSSVAVERAVGALLADLGARGSDYIPNQLRLRQGLREQAGRLFGVPATQIALGFGTTRGILDLSTCIDWRPGERILSFLGEFPANITPYQITARAHGLGLELLPLTGFGDGSGEGLERLAAEFARGGVAAVAVSAVQFQSGLAMPLQEMAQLCRSHDALLLVDAIQGAGIVPLDGVAWDGLVTGAHKWLMGLEGSGITVVGPRLQARLLPRVGGWLSHEEPVRFLLEGAGHLRYDRPFQPAPLFLEGSAPNAVGLAALSASLELLLELGIPRIFEHVQTWHDIVEPHLKERGFVSLRSADPNARSGSLCVQAPPGVAAGPLLHRLSASGVTLGYPDGNIRISPHWCNSFDQIPLFLSSLDRALGRQTPSGERRTSAAVTRNTPPILAFLQKTLPPSGRLLEIASGGGAHAAALSRALPGWSWQPSEGDVDNLPSIHTFLQEGGPGLLPPLHLNVCEIPPVSGMFDAMLCVNMVHASPIEATHGLLHLAGKYLKPGGQLVLYGPYRRSGIPTAPSNEVFEEWLKSRDPRWGLRWLEDLQGWAQAQGLTLEVVEELPANNLGLTFRRIVESEPAT